MTTVVLTGFMGTGKSTIGRALAAALGYAFVDTDALIVERHGEIEAIFATLGEQAFRAMERAVADELAARDEVVIATGGRFMLDPHNAAALADARVFTLAADVEEIVRRVSADGIASRPLLANADDPAAVVAELLNQRRDAYGAFETIDTTSRAIGEVVEDLAARLDTVI